ncbi:MAG TPA: hypothetical protein VF384_13520 [Planctomycetota bacterium]
MKIVPSLLLPAVLASVLAPTACAQDPTGSYELLKKDGSPVEPNHVWGVIVMPVFGIPGWYVFAVYRDGDPVPNEGGRIVATGPGTYAWENSRGTTGTLRAAPGGDFVSTVTSGPNQGTERLWDKQ